MRKATAFALCCAVALCLAPAMASGIVINEVVASHTGTDNREFIELCGTPGQALTDIYLVVVEGDTGVSNPGNLDRVTNLSTASIPADGYFVAGDNGVLNLDFSLGTQDYFENSTETILIVYATTPPVVNTDIDTNNDGVPEISIGTIIDGVCLRDTGTMDFCYYGVPSVGPDGSNFPAGTQRCPDCTGSFSKMMCFTYPITLCSGGTYANPSPGTTNTDCPVVSTEETTWGNVKGLFR